MFQSGRYAARHASNDGTTAWRIPQQRSLLQHPAPCTLHAGLVGCETRRLPTGGTGLVLVGAGLVLVGTGLVLVGAALVLVGNGLVLVGTGLVLVGTGR